VHGHGRGGGNRARHVFSRSKNSARDLCRPTAKVAKLALFLLSAAGSSIAAQVVAIDAGWSVSG
jgi:enoyl-[acyl-carrier-protein] reductase (NADH)